MEPIQTRYNGYHFRSRLEARWAVWLDNLGIKYRYEPEGFDFDTERYLPDFWLQNRADKPWREGKPQVTGYWLEIKPKKLNARELRCLTLLAMYTKHHAYSFFGEPGIGDFGIYIATLQGQILMRSNRYCEWCKGIGYDFVLFPEFPATECSFCTEGKPNPEMFVAMNLHGFFCNLFDYPDEDIPNIEKVKDAFNKARSARFEFGQSGPS